MITSHSQRWRDGRTIFVRGEAFDPARYSVRAIGEKDARSFVVSHHYSQSFPAARHSVGLYRQGADGRAHVVGVAVFSVPMNQAVVPKYTGLLAEAGVELGRFVLLDDAPMPAESWFLSRAFANLRAAKPGIEAVVSYADPATWRSSDGMVVKPGHIGKAYWALSARYHGRTDARSRWVAGEGRAVSERALSKIRNAESGHAYAAAQLVALGAEAPAEGQCRRAWLEGLSRQGFLRRALAPGKHAYAWGLTRRARATARRFAPLPYPLIGDPSACDVTGLPLFG